MASKIALQLFTVREHTKTASDFSQTLQKARAIGYTAVQLSAVGCMNGEQPEVDAQTAKQMLDDNGLRCIATHRSWDDLLHHTQREIEFHQILECDFVAIGGIGSHEQSCAGYRQWIQEAQPMIQEFKKIRYSFCAS
ncbi:MAG: hypothetical protein HRU15_00185 [Planctomycetes bacterium]|nr:hypothetical protein [Planctomycetota bacterium]